MIFSTKFLLWIVDRRRRVVMKSINSTMLNVAFSWDIVSMVDGASRRRSIGRLMERRRRRS